MPIVSDESDDGGDDEETEDGRRLPATDDDNSYRSPETRIITVKAGQYWKLPQLMASHCAKKTNAVT